MPKLRMRDVMNVGYTVLADGDKPRCRLPDTRGFGRGAMIRCDTCGRTASTEYNGFVGLCWQGPMHENQ